MTPLQDRLIRPSTPVQSQDDGGPSTPRLDIEVAIRESLAACDIRIKSAAGMMGLDSSQFVRQLQGDGHVPFDRLVDLPISVQRLIVDKWATAVGLQVVISRDVTRANLTRLMHVMVDCLATLEDER